MFGSSKFEVQSCLSNIELQTQQIHVNSVPNYSNSPEDEWHFHLNVPPISRNTVTGASLK